MAKAKERLFMGLASGWGADGVDAALVAVAGRGERIKVRQLFTHFEPFDDDLRVRIMAAASGGMLPSRLTALDGELAAAFARSAQRLIEVSRTARDEIVAIGSSGQLIGRGERATLALGSPAIIAAQSRRPVAAGFAASDLAAGGNGAVRSWPDWLVFHDRRLSRVVIHLGGLASVTFVPAAAMPGDVLAFDAGPAGLLLDALAQRVVAQPYDADGAAAARGRVHGPLLNELLSHTHFQAALPKFTTAVEWGGVYLQRLEMAASRHGCSDADLLTTVAELVARSLADAIGKLTERPHEVILSGGGSRNIHLASRIRAMLSPSSTYSVERYGLDARAHSAARYAILAAARVDEHPAQCGRELPTADAAGEEHHRAILGGLWLA